MTVRAFQRTRLDVAAPRLRWKHPFAVRTCYSHLKYGGDSLGHRDSTPRVVRFSVLNLNGAVTDVFPLQPETLLGTVSTLRRRSNSSGSMGLSYANDSETQPAYRASGLTLSYVNLRLGPLTGKWSMVTTDLP